MTAYAFYESPFGLLKIGVANGKVILIGMVPKADTVSQPTPLSAEVYRQLQEYFAGKRTVFTVPYAFQVAKIPYGRTVTYKTSRRLLENRAPFRQQAEP